MVVIHNVILSFLKLKWSSPTDMGLVFEFLYVVATAAYFSTVLKSLYDIHYFL